MAPIPPNKFVFCSTQFTPDLCNVLEEPGKSRVYITPDGNSYPSITSLLSKTMSADKVAIIKDWQDWVGLEEAEKIKNTAGNRGSILHTAIENYLFHGTLSDKVLFKQCKKQLDRINNIRLLEKPLYSDILRVAGRVDCIAEFDGKLSVIDFKTSTKTKTPDMIEDYYIQETFYGVAYKEHFGETIEQLVTIIATERSLKPYVYIKKFDDYVSPLLKKVNKYYANAT